MSQITEPAQAVLSADPEDTDTETDQGSPAEAIRKNVAAFRADGNVSMMGGWTE
ncbi:hypothetical protein [Streptomyces sp. NPDC046685]|uniref:hypothetical protein n=1 Tax=Streptomyces sp. NPDC046685 TaxID=3157202 RepID=UPI0033E3BC39